MKKFVYHAAKKKIHATPALKKMNLLVWVLLTLAIKNPISVIGRHRKNLSKG